MSQDKIKETPYISGQNKRDTLYLRTKLKRHLMSQDKIKETPYISGQNKRDTLCLRTK
jgi:hypothetical protein